MGDHGNGDLNEGGKIDLAAHARRAGLKRSAGSVGSGLKRGWEIKGERSVGRWTDNPSISKGIDHRLPPREQNSKNRLPSIQ